MIYQLGSCQNPWRTSLTPQILTSPSLKKSPFYSRPILCFHPQNPDTMNRAIKPRTQLKKPILLTSSTQVFHKNSEQRSGGPLVGSSEMLALCGLGYWVQGFRCFPWLALNFHMTHNLNLQPSTLQLVQHSGNLPMAAKPLYGILSDAFYINGAHRIPYISIGGWLTFDFSSLMSLVFVLNCLYCHTSCILIVLCFFVKLFSKSPR